MQEQDKATNKPAGNGHRNGAVRKPSQLKTKIMGEAPKPSGIIQLANSWRKRKMAGNSKGFARRSNHPRAQREKAEPAERLGLKPVSN
jgi:hypothetical protein